VVLAILAVALLGLAGLLLLSPWPVIGPVERPAPEGFSAKSIAQGEALAAAGHCASCHTRPGGQPFAGGYGVNTPFGIIYGANITPDPMMSRRCTLT
jgi:mono/diheme cytochrome c family protein